jgi:hypothetical protein
VTLDPTCRHGRNLLHACRKCGRPPMFRRLAAQPPSRPAAFELVFSRYNEPVDFLAEWPHEAKVYNKGEPVVLPERTYWAGGVPFRVRPRLPPIPIVVDRPNAGMDTESILHHLATRYDTLADVTLFLAGNWQKWRDGYGHLANVNPCLEGFYRERSWDPQWPIRGHRWVQDDGWPGKVAHYGKWAEMLATGEIEPSPYTLGEFWDRVIGGERPQHLIYCPGQTFSVPRAFVYHRPREWYQRMAEWFGGARKRRWSAPDGALVRPDGPLVLGTNDQRPTSAAGADQRPPPHPYPEECHHMERLWLYVFRPGGRAEVDLP